MSSEADCLFCHIIKGNIPSLKIAETPLSYAFMDIHPIANKHSLVISKQHRAKLHELDNKSLVDLLPLVKKIAIATGADEYNVLQNNGKGAYQSVDHVHFHIIPKLDPKQGLTLTQEGWPTTDPSKEDLQKSLDEMLQVIKEKL